MGLLDQFLAPQERLAGQGLLAQIFSSGDRAKRYLTELLTDPAGSAARTTGQFLDNQRALQDVMPDPRKPQTAESVRPATDMVLNSLLGFAPVGMIAYHGSPHVFNKFDSSKIGTGEGAQAYGHGLYLAESPDVAKSYQSALSAERGFSYGGKTGLTRAEVEDMVNARYGGGYLDGVIRPSGVAGSFIDDMVTGTRRAEGAYPRQYKPGSQRAKIYDELRGQIQHADPGSLYKVDLPDSAVARMLDWDKPLSQQAPEVKGLLRKHGISGNSWDVQALGDGPQGYLNDRYIFDSAIEARNTINELRQQGYYARPFKNAMGKDKTGAEFVRNWNDPAAQSEKLRQIGIPGIRYLDGGSRGAGQGSSNFVIFPGEENLLTILERNGIPLGAP
jgi:hypothetical protein